MKLFCRMIAFVTAVLIMILSVGCADVKLYGGESSLEPETVMMNGEKNGIWAAYFGRGLTDDELTARDYVISAAQQLEKKGEIERYMLFSCDDNEETQIRQMKEAAIRGYDVFLLDPCGVDSLKCAKELMESGSIVFAAEISEEYSMDGVLGINCSTENSDRAAADYICSAVGRDKQAYVLMLTEESAFGERKHDVFSQVLEAYPEFISVADLQYAVGDDPVPTLRMALTELLRVEPQIVWNKSELIIFCDRIDGEMLNYILENAPTVPMLAVSDRLDFLDQLTIAAQNGVHPRFAIVNSPEDVPSIAMNIAVRAASGDTFRKEAMTNGQIMIDITFFMTDEAFDTDVIELGIADDTYIATGIMQDVVTGLFR